MKKLILLILAALLFICFNKIALASTYDDFNDGKVDENKWSFLNEDLQFFSENSGTFNINWNGLPPAKQDPFIRSRAWFGGNFDISVKYENLSMDKVYSSTNNNPTLLDLQLQDRSVPLNPPTHSYIFRGWSPSSDDVYYSSLYKNGVWQGESASQQTDNTSGYLRITRTGSTIDTYHADTSKQWVHLDTYNNAFTGPADITLFSVMENNVNSFHVKLDNVQVTADKTIPPQSNPPSLPQMDNLKEVNTLSSLKNLINPNVPPNPNKPSIILVHGRQDNYENWPKQMELSLANTNRIEESNYNILAWDWKDAANYPLNGWGLNYLQSNALMQGSKLSTELINSNLTNNDIHLIGHSAGGILINETAATLRRLGFDKVEQLTFLDPLDPVDTLDGSNAIWSDNYYSYLIDYTWPPTTPLGSPIKNANNEYLGRNSHEYPVEWYINTVEDDSILDGFYWSKEGGGWNQKPPTTTPSLISTIATPFKETFDSIGDWIVSGNVYFLQGMGFLKESSPAYLFEDISIQSDINYLSFDFKFTELGDGDFLKLYFDDQFLFAYEGIYFTGNDFINSGMIDISQFAGRNGRLIFALENFGDANSEIAIDNLEFHQASPVPEPSTFILSLIGCLGMAALRFKKLAS